MKKKLKRKGVSLKKLVQESKKNYRRNLKQDSDKKELDHYYGSIIACMPNNVYWLDRNCVLQGGNNNLVKLFGLKSREDLVGLTYEEMTKLANWTEGQGEAFKKAELEVMESGVAKYNVDEPPIVVDGETRYYMSSKVPLYNLKREIIGVVGISTDITERKLVEVALKEAKEKAEAANKVKTEFLENMRHDIRTPLTGIVGFANIIKNEVSDPKVAEYVENLTASSEALMNFLNEILEAIKVSSGEVPVLKKKFDLEEKLKDVIALNIAKAKQKNIELSFEYDDSIPHYVIGDSTRIYRIALELIVNALNFTNSGSVKLSVELAKKMKKSLIVKLIVEDTGIGIPLDKQQEIFLQFKRLTPSYEGIYKGAGLGLAIVKQFIDEVDGEIYVESEVDVGTKFICVLPLKKTLLDESLGSEELFPLAKQKIRECTSKSNGEASYKQLKETGKKSILVVEDEQMSAFVVKSILEDLGCQVDVASNGEQALKLAREKKYQLIFMDIGLPDISGCEVTRQIRQSELKQDNHVPIIALTAHIDEENKRHCIEVGMNAVMAKPLIKDKARDILVAFIATDGKSAI